MNKTFLLVVGLLVVAGIVFGGYKLWNHYKKSVMMQNTEMAPTSTPVTSTTGSGLPNKTDTSNGQLDQDVQSVQNSMNQLNKDQNTSSQDVVGVSQDIPQQ